MSSTTPRETVHELGVLDTFISYRETGTGSPYAPYPDPASRRPMLQWPREIPIEGEPADVAAVITRNGEWLAKTPEVPKQLLTFDGTGLSNAPAVVEWARGTFPKLDVVPLGSAGHHAPEDAPKEIAGAITSWLDRLPGESPATGHP